MSEPIREAHEDAHIARRSPMLVNTCVSEVYDNVVGSGLDDKVLSLERGAAVEWCSISIDFYATTRPGACAAAES